MVDLSIVGKLNDFKARVDALPERLLASVSYKQRGGLHFIRVGPVSGSWSIKRAKPALKRDASPDAPATVATISADRMRFVR